MGAGGKGSGARPYSVDKKTFENNWDAIFGKKKVASQEPAKEQVFNDIHPESARHDITQTPQESSK